MRTKEQQLKIAEHSGADVGGHSHKADIKSVLTTALVIKAVLDKPSLVQVQVQLQLLGCFQLLGSHLSSRRSYFCCRWRVRKASRLLWKG